MKHPDREEWIPFVFGEANPETRTRLRRHLDECPDCAREVSGWRRSLHKLDRWRLPRAERASAVFSVPVLRWAVAGVVLAAGVLVGRLSGATAGSTATLRAEVEASVRASLEGEMNQALRQVQDRAMNAVADAEVRLTRASAAERQRLWRGLLEVIDTTRAQDARAVQAMVHDSERRQETELVALRKDLEVLASTADEEIRQARFKLLQLAAVKDSTE
jgi:anti-sigma factor RsiW